jgi:hypothetical protein
VPCIQECRGETYRLRRTRSAGDKKAEKRNSVLLHESAISIYNCVLFFYFLNNCAETEALGATKQRCCLMARGHSAYVRTAVPYDSKVGTIASEQV